MRKTDILLRANTTALAVGLCLEAGCHSASAPSEVAVGYVAGKWQYALYGEHDNRSKAPRVWWRLDLHPDGTGIWRSEPTRLGRHTTTYPLYWFVSKDGKAAVFTFERRSNLLTAMLTKDKMLANISKDGKTLTLLLPGQPGEQYTRSDVATVSLR